MSLPFLQEDSEVKRPAKQSCAYAERVGP